MNVTNIIISPLITEKTHLLKMGEKPKLSFIVNKKSNKIEIKKAFLAIFGIKPLSINTLIRKPQPTRFILKSRKNFTKSFKVAHITISKVDYENMQKIASENNVEK